MKIFPKSYRRLSKRFGVWVSNYYTPTQFAVRGRYEASYKLGQYVELDAPGTGFFCRTTTSHSYRNYLRHERARLKPNYWRMLTGTQFSFEKELKRASKALDNAQDEEKKRILESYMNVLALAMEAEELERLIQAIKQQSRVGRLKRHQTSVLTSFKSRLARLGHDVRALQIMIKNECPEEQYRAFAAPVLAFSMVAASHRIWHMRGQGESSEAHQVFFDMGIFDYIQSPLMTPLMRDSDGVRYFLFPNYLIVSRDSTDFDIISLNDLTFIFRELPYDRILTAMTPSDFSSYRHRHHHRHHPAVSDPDGNLLRPAGVETEMESTGSEKVRMRVVGEMFIPQLKLRFCSQDVKAMNGFVLAINEYKDKYFPEA